MKTDAHPGLRNRALTLQKWLRQRVLNEALYQFLAGAVFLAFGAGIFAFVLYLPVVVLFSYFNLDFNLRNGLLVACLFFILLGSAFLIASRNQFGLAYPTRRKPEATPFFDVLDRFLFAAPSQLQLSFECLQKCVRLLRCDVPRVAVILLWLFDRRRKATVEEISAALSGSDSVRLLPQLRDIPGVIWLTYGYGVLILSLEMRLSIARELRETLRQPRVEIPPDDEPQEPPPRPDFSQDREMIGWYLALNLPPFAPLEKVRQRYRQLVKIYHPDARSGPLKISDDQIKRINTAYHNILKSSKSGI